MQISAAEVVGSTHGWKTETGSVPMTSMDWKLWAEWGTAWNLPFTSWAAKSGTKKKHRLEHVMGLGIRFSRFPWKIKPALVWFSSPSRVWLKKHFPRLYSLARSRAADVQNCKAAKHFPRYLPNTASSWQPLTQISPHFPHIAQL